MTSRRDHNAKAWMAAGQIAASHDWQALEVSPFVYDEQPARTN